MFHFIRVGMTKNAIKKVFIRVKKTKRQIALSAKNYRKKMFSQENSTMANRFKNLNFFSDGCINYIEVILINSLHLQICEKFFCLIIISSEH